MPSRDIRPMLRINGNREDKLTTIWGIPHLVKRPAAGDLGISRKDPRWFRCEYQGKDAWTNTHLADVRQPQYNDFMMMLRQYRGPGPNLTNLIPAEMNESPLKLLITKTMFINAKVASKDLFLSDGEHVVMVNPVYYDYFAYFYPNATFHCQNAKQPIIVKDAGSFVGVLMQMNCEESELDKAVAKAEALREDAC